MSRFCTFAQYGAKKAMHFRHLPCRFRRFCLKSFSQADTQSFFFSWNSLGFRILESHNSGNLTDLDDISWFPWRWFGLDFVKVTFWTNFFPFSRRYLFKTHFFEKTHFCSAALIFSRFEKNVNIKMEWHDLRNLGNCKFPKIERRKKKRALNF